MNMKKRSLLIALTVVSMLGISAIAQSNVDEVIACDSAKQCKKEKICKGENKKHGKKLLYLFFEGIQLTPGQQTKVNELIAERKTSDYKIKEQYLKSEHKNAEKFEKGLRKHLTPEQYAKYMDNCHKFHAKKHDKGIKNCTKDKKCCREGKHQNKTHKFAGKSKEKKMKRAKDGNVFEKDMSEQHRIDNSKSLKARK